MRKTIIMCLLGILSIFGIAQNRLPDIVLKTAEGTKINVQDINKNSLAIISFWATWCGPCIKELDAFDAVDEEWRKQFNYEFYAVSIDDSRTVSKVKTMVNGKGWDYNVILDTNHELKRAMNVSNPPHLFIVKNGGIIYQHRGYTPGSEMDIYEKLKEISNK